LSVRANFNRVEGHFPSHDFVHRLDDVRLDDAVPDIGLIRHDDRHKSAVTQRSYGFDGPGKQPKILEAARCMGFSIAHLAAHEDTVAIEKYRWPPVAPVRAVIGCVHRLLPSLPTRHRI